MIAALFALVVIAGCATPPPRSDAGIDARGKPTIRQSGEAAAPASASVTTTVSTLTIPAGSTIATPAPAPSAGEPAPAPLIVTLSQPSELRTETRREAVEGAKTPEPPLPPSPSDKARATGIRWFYFAGVAAGVAALILIWRAHPMAAACCGGAALAFPIVGNLASEKWAVAVAGALLCASGAFYVAWKIIAARHGLDQKA